MFASIITRSKLPLAVLSVAVLVALSGHPAPAEAQGPRAFQRAPGQVSETITPATTVVSTAHYQAELTLTCPSDEDFCQGDFPRAGIGRQLNLTRMTCYLQGSPNSTFSVGLIELRQAAGSHVLYQFLPVEHSAPNGFHTLNRAVDVRVAAKQYITVRLHLLLTDTPMAATCTAIGTLDTLG
jgi:hypothetical protein